jgi:hypothetical protein
MPKSDQVLASLRASTESHTDEWGMVYLDNARARLAGMSDKSFRSYLARLSRDGLYKPVDGYAWGEVKL